VRVALAVTLRVPVDSVPLVALAPVQSPLAMHDVAFVVDQVRVLVPGETTVLGAALRLTVGAAGAGLTVTVVDWLALPPAPEQVRV
jgi:hypothetical protein